ncbi:MAG: hypothetical protein WBB47_07600 [Paenisporosarcina sp.]
MAVLAGMVWSVKQMPEVHEAIADDYYADFDQELDRLVNHNDGVDEVIASHTGSHLDVDIYIVDDYWDELNESEKLKMATDIGSALHGSNEEPMVIDFRSMLGREVIVEGNLDGEFTVIK